jgi:hypothetical protein
MSDGPNKPMPLILADADNKRSSLPKIHERNVNVKVIDEGKSYLRVHASLLDVEHSFQAEMVVDIATGRIEEVAAVMAQRPYKTYCPYALDNVQKLRGDVIGPGISRRIIEKVGRSTGCFHLVEIFQAAVSFAATILLGKRARTDGLLDETATSEEEHREKWMPYLKNTCQVFRVDALQSKEKP